MNEFRLFAHGENFDPDSYVTSTPLKFDGVWHKGENWHDHPESSGVFKALGNANDLTLFEQEEIAVAYLSANREELKALGRHKEVTTFILGLQYNLEICEGTIGFCMGLSDLLMQICLEIGISPVFYVSVNARRARRNEASRTKAFTAFASHHKPGDTIEASVRHTCRRGLIVILDESLEVIVPRTTEHPPNLCFLGTTIECEIVAIDHENKTVSLRLLE